MFAFSRGIACFVAINLLLVFAFPPFEPYQSLLRMTGSTFDSFYFIFGDRSQRPIFTPLLHLESVFIAINALALLLLFNAVKRSDDAACQQIMALSETLPDKALLDTCAELRQRAQAHHAHQPSAPEARTNPR